MSTEPATSRARTTCNDCGLPYYADENDACPYCETSTTQADEGTAAETDTETEIETATEPQREGEPTSPERRRRASRSSSQSLLQRITNGIRDAFRR